MAIENATMFERVMQRQRELEKQTSHVEKALDLANNFSRQTSFSSLMTEICKCCTDAFEDGTSKCNLYMYHPKTQELTCAISQNIVAVSTAPLARPIVNSTFQY